MLETLITAAKIRAGLAVLAKPLRVAADFVYVASHWGEISKEREEYRRQIKDIMDTAPGGSMILGSSTGGWIMLDTTPSRFRYACLPAEGLGASTSAAAGRLAA